MRIIIFLFFISITVVGCQSKAKLPTPNEAELMVRKHYMHADNRDSASVMMVNDIIIKSVTKDGKENVVIEAFVNGVIIKNQRRDTVRYKDLSKTFYEWRSGQWVERDDK